MDAMAAAASKMKNETASASTPPKKKSTRVAEAIRAWQRCPKAWRAKLVEGGEPGTSEVEKLKRAEKRKGTWPRARYGRNAALARRRRGGRNLVGKFPSSTFPPRSPALRSRRRAALVV